MGCCWCVNVQIFLFGVILLCVKCCKHFAHLSIECMHSLVHRILWEARTNWLENEIMWTQRQRLRQQRQHSRILTTRSKKKKKTSHADIALAMKGKILLTNVDDDDDYTVGSWILFHDFIAEEKWCCFWCCTTLSATEDSLLATQNTYFLFLLLFSYLVCCKHEQPEVKCIPHVLVCWANAYSYLNPKDKWFSF